MATISTAALPYPRRREALREESLSDSAGAFASPFGLGASGAGLGASGAGLGASGAGLGASGAGLGVSGAGLGASGAGLGASGADLGVSGAGLGVSGAGLGLISAVTMLCLGAWGVRCFGSFAEGLQPTSAKEHHGKPLHSQDSESAPLVSLKKALDNSPISDLLNKLDPLPQNFYPRLQKVAQLLTSPKAKERFMADPILAPLSKNSKLLALQSDPALLESLQSGDLWSIIRNPKVLAAASDAQLLTALRASELDKALDRALTSGGALPASPEPVKAAKTAPPPLRAKP